MNIKKMYVVIFIVQNVFCRFFLRRFFKSVQSIYFLKHSHVDSCFNRFLLTLYTIISSFRKKNMLTELFVRYVLKSIICLLFADFPELLVFAFINVVDIIVGYLAITSFFSNVRLVNCWMFKFRIPKTSGKKELSNIVMIVFQLSFM